MLSDISYGDILSDASPSTVELIKGLASQGLWRYTSVLLAQPFESAKTILQVQLADGIAEHTVGKSAPKESRQRRRDIYEVLQG